MKWLREQNCNTDNTWCIYVILITPKTVYVMPQSCSFLTQYDLCSIHILIIQLLFGCISWHTIYFSCTCSMLCLHGWYRIFPSTARLCVWFTYALCKAYIHISINDLCIAASWFIMTQQYCCHGLHSSFWCYDSYD